MRKKLRFKAQNARSTIKMPLYRDFQYRITAILMAHLALAL